MKNVNETIREQVIIKVSKQTGIEQKKLHQMLSNIIDFTLSIKDELNREILDTLAEDNNELPKELAELNKRVVLEIKKGLQL
jgi:hypothetical protein